MYTYYYYSMVLDHLIIYYYGTIIYPVGTVVLWPNHYVETIQWNPSIMATIGTKDFGHYRGVTTNQGIISV